MSPEQLDLARRLVACDQWRWVDGMLYGYISCDLYHSHSTRYRPCDAMDVSLWPNLSDYATAAILLVMVCESIKGEVSATLTRGWWWLGSYDGHSIDEQRHKDLGTAAARALLAIWEAP